MMMMMAMIMMMDDDNDDDDNYYYFVFNYNCFCRLVKNARIMISQTCPLTKSQVQ